MMLNRKTERLFLGLAATTVVCLFATFYFAFTAAAQTAPAKEPANLSLEDENRIRSVQAEALTFESQAKQMFNDWLLTEAGRRFSQMNEQSQRKNLELQNMIQMMQQKYGASGYELRPGPTGNLVWTKIQTVGK